jgi:hypothetical protein
MSRHAIILLALGIAGIAQAGPYAAPGINGYIDPATWRHADSLAPNAVPNPIFRGWAVQVVEYAPADQIWSGLWNDPNKALGPATGHNFDIVSLGDLSDEEFTPASPPGYVTLGFGARAAGTTIRNGKGYDFAVFENAFISQSTTALGSFAGQMLAELAYIEVSSNGRDFVRFPCVSLTPGPVGRYGTIEISDIHNLAGKHPNAHGTCTGTPFDLEDLVHDPNVVAGRVDLNDIAYVRIVDVPGSGAFLDDAPAYLDPGVWPARAGYPAAHPIYDMWPTQGSGGFDLEAVGVLHEQQYDADINLDGTVDYLDLAMFSRAWGSDFGAASWNDRCDLGKEKDLFVDGRDFAVFAAQWRHVESWRKEFKDE